MNIIIVGDLEVKSSSNKIVTRSHGLQLKRERDREREKERERWRNGERDIEIEKKEKNNSLQEKVGWNYIHTLLSLK